MSIVWDYREGASCGPDEAKMDAGWGTIAPMVAIFSQDGADLTTRVSPVHIVDSNLRPLDGACNGGLYAQLMSAAKACQQNDFNAVVLHIAKSQMQIAETLLKRAGAKTSVVPELTEDGFHRVTLGYRRCGKSFLQQSMKAMDELKGRAGLDVTNPDVPVQMTYHGVPINTAKPEGSK